MANAKFLTVTTSNGKLHFTLGTGAALTLDPEGLTQTIREQAMMHGLNQKIRDAAAGFSKSGDFIGAYNAMSDVIEALYEEKWNRAGGGTATGGFLAEAIVELKGCTLAQAQAAVAKATDEQKKAWKSNAKIAAIVTRLQAERAAKRAADADEDLEIDIE
jgi:hypothetical protein